MGLVPHASLSLIFSLLMSLSLSYYCSFFSLALSLSIFSTTTMGVTYWICAHCSHKLRSLVDVLCPLRSLSFSYSLPLFLSPATAMGAMYRTCTPCNYGLQSVVNVMNDECNVLDLCHMQSRIAECGGCHAPVDSHIENKKVSYGVYMVLGSSFSRVSFEVEFLQGP